MIEVVKNPEKLDEFYEDWSLVFTGVIEEEIPMYFDFLRQYTKVEDRGYIITGKMMNEKYGLTGDNQYQDDLHFLVVMLKDIEDVGQIAIPRFMVGGRWFNDIVDNNSRREVDAKKK